MSVLRPCDELKPVVRWLSKNDPEGTYTAGLQACALALVRKDTELGKEALAGLNLSKKYVINEMGIDGGYTYGEPKADADTSTATVKAGGKPKPEKIDLEGAWTEYVNALRNKSPKPEDEKTKVINLLKAAARTASGIQGHLESLVADIKLRGAEARGRNDGAAAKHADEELAELRLAYNELIAIKVDGNSALSNAQRRYDEAVKALKTGAKKQDGKPKTKEELQAEAEKARVELANQEAEAVKRFAPKGDLSNGQYGTLGAWALADYDIELPNAYWKISDRFWRLTQKADGSWPYSDGSWEHGFSGIENRPAMSLAGIASLFITSEMVDNGPPRLEPRVDKEIDKGLGWLAANFDPRGDLYYMYGAERVGLASGLKFFGSINWYRQGAAAIISRQNGGNWNESFPGNPNQNITTAYALLFLARGRNPVLFNKLQYEGPWNARPRDNANVTAWISKKFERPINWQIVNLKVSPDEWVDAPILLITGSKALKFDKEDIEKLRTFINGGGMIFSTADGEKAEFTESVRKLAGEVVEKKYEMRELKKDHILFGSDFWPIANPPKIISMSNGIREVWVHSSSDMGASWQGRRVATKEHFDFPANLLRYASGKMPLKTKLQAIAVAPSGRAADRTVQMARVDYGGNDNPEPGAWPRMAQDMREDTGTAIDLKSVKIQQLDFKATPIAHMTGTTGFPAAPADVAALQKYLNDGGMLFADAAGGSAEFTKSFVQLMGQVFPKATIESIPSSSPICNGTLSGGVDLTGAKHLLYRTYYRQKAGTQTVPQLQGIKVGTRYAVIFSAEDVTSGLLGTNTWGILGYNPEWAQAIARNVILYSLNPTGGQNAAAPAPAN